MMYVDDFGRVALSRTIGPRLTASEARLAHGMNWKCENGGPVPSARRGHDPSELLEELLHV